MNFTPFAFLNFIATLLSFNTLLQIQCQLLLHRFSELLCEIWSAFRLVELNITMQFRWWMNTKSRLDFFAKPRSFHVQFYAQIFNFGVNERYQFQLKMMRLQLKLIQVSSDWRTVSWPRAKVTISSHDIRNHQINTWSFTREIWEACGLRLS